MTAPGTEDHLRYIRATAAAMTDQVKRLGPNQWMADIHARAATCYQLQTVAESAQRLPDELKARHPDVPWRAIGGMRNALAHAYLTINPAIVLSVVTDHVPLLAAVASAEIGRERARGVTDEQAIHPGRVAGVSKPAPEGPSDARGHRVRRESGIEGPDRSPALGL